MTFEELAAGAASQMYETVRLEQDARQGHAVARAVREAVSQTLTGVARESGVWEALPEQEQLEWSRCAVRLWRLFERVHELQTAALSRHEGNRDVGIRLGPAALEAARRARGEGL